MSVRLRLILCLCLVAVLGTACSTPATQTPPAVAPSPAPANITPMSPPGQLATGSASSLGIPGATPETRMVRPRLSADLAEAGKVAGFPVWAPDPNVLGDGSAFAQIALFEVQKSNSDPNNPVQAGPPVVEMIYRGANGYWVFYQGIGTANDFKWRFPYFGKGYEEGTVRGQKAWFSSVTGANEAALYWEEAGRLFVVGGRYSRPDYIKIAESVKPLK